jgi:hypothetical protein
MKKTYICPIMDVDEVKEQTLLASSVKLGDDYTEGDVVLSPELDTEDDDWGGFK